jgi:hypothetical protein
MKFEYYGALGKLEPECPPPDREPVNLQAFRWVTDPAEQEDNYIPQILKAPYRYNDKTDLQKCDGYALSMFISLETVIARFDYFVDLMNENAFANLGTHVASAQINVRDGVGSVPGKNGHFNFHTAEDHGFAARFAIVAPLRK